MPTQGVEGLREGDEIAGYEPGSLMDQLVEGMLAVGSRLTPVDRSGVVVDENAVAGHMLPVALHGELLEIGRKALQILLIWKHCAGLRAEEIVVPDGQETHEHRKVARKRRGAEMLVHCMESLQHGLEMIRADRNHGRKTDGGIHRVTPSDPVPEL